MLDFIEYVVTNTQTIALDRYSIEQAPAEMTEMPF